MDQGGSTLKTVFFSQSSKWHSEFMIWAFWEYIHPNVWHEAITLLWVVAKLEEAPPPREHFFEIPPTLKSHNFFLPNLFQ